MGTYKQPSTYGITNSPKCIIDHVTVFTDPHAREGSSLMIPCGDQFWLLAGQNVIHIPNCSRCQQPGKAGFSLLPGFETQPGIKGALPLPLPVSGGRRKRSFKGLSLTPQQKQHGAATVEQNPGGHMELHYLSKGRYCRS